MPGGEASLAGGFLSVKSTKYFNTQTIHSVCVGVGTVPQEGDIFDCFRNAFFPVCMINLGYSTHVFSMGTFLFQLMSNTRTFEFFNGQKLSKM